MLRLLVATLVLANGLFFAWNQGWFAPAWPPPRHAEREPARLATQVRPEALVVLSAPAASAAVSAARAAVAACLQAGPIAEDAIEAAEQALAAARPASGAWTREPVPPPPRWLLYSGRHTDAALRRTREAELTRLGLRYEELQAPPEWVPGFVLGRHASREDAEAALAALTQAGTLPRGLRVLELPAAAPQFWLRVPQAAPDLAERLRALPASSLGEGFRPCAEQR